MFDLSQKVALVTGAGSGIGKQVCSSLAERGAVVAGADLRGAEHTPDVTDPAAVHEVVARVVAEHGRLDIVVNSAGVARLADAAELGEDDWDLTLDVNLKGTFFVCQAAAPQMIEQGGGRIINLASQAASVALAGHAAYCASKAGVNGLTRVLALERGPFGICVNAVSPTVVLTDLGRKAWDNPAGEAHRAEIPNGRFAEPEEVAAAVCYLASDEAAMVNGSELRVDGGFTIR
ncbi:GolD/DthD family dehydrogenase [Naumannella halotolerans]|uniref:NAD(P)-dependent dehydrogenase (Short-subunit alcohol dehydrogenase family) n=1 Tax=Naumannella halotolerans TaxID=993414 RepID=A0A4R7JAP5_9ACTN|nr:D-threitol dehydrogenase [Naumannella halotolerans]TDT33469.1 NAD(P)-dependent dehydrogenase (short-subunit alcohol dehydrogenase family) [Naumannella halotolerans]